MIFFSWYSQVLTLVFLSGKTVRSPAHSFYGGKDFFWLVLSPQLSLHFQVSSTRPLYFLHDIYAGSVWAEWTVKRSVRLNCNIIASSFLTCCTRWLAMHTAWFYMSCEVSVCCYQHDGSDLKLVCGGQSTKRFIWKQLGKATDLSAKSFQCNSSSYF